MIPSNYRVISHCLAKLYGLILERIEYMGRTTWLPFSQPGRFPKRVHNFGSHIENPVFIKEVRAHNS